MIIRVLEFVVSRNSSPEPPDAAPAPIAYEFVEFVVIIPLPEPAFKLTIETYVDPEP
jgi:hypothetical protein